MPQIAHKRQLTSTVRTILIPLISYSPDDPHYGLASGPVHTSLYVRVTWEWWLGPLPVPRNGRERRLVELTNGCYPLVKAEVTPRGCHREWMTEITPASSGHPLSLFNNLKTLLSKWLEQKSKTERKNRSCHGQCWGQRIGHTDIWKYSWDTLQNIRKYEFAIYVYTAYVFRDTCYVYVYSILIYTYMYVHIYPNTIIFCMYRCKYMYIFIYTHTSSTILFVGCRLDWY